MPNLVPAAYPGLPVEALSEAHDFLTLALDAGEKAQGYSPAEREARSYMRRARARLTRLLDARPR